MPRVIQYNGTSIQIESTEWMFRRSTEHDTDLYDQPVPPGHFVLYMEDDDGGDRALMPLEYISRTEGMGPIRKRKRTTRPLYIVIEDIVWRGTLVLEES